MADNSEVDNLGDRKPRLKKIRGLVVAFFALTAAVFGTLADSKSFFEGCNSKSDASNIPLERIEVDKVKFGLYAGRFGCSFLIPFDWEPWVDPDFASMDKLILHPLNPEIGIQYFDIYSSETDEKGNIIVPDIREIADEEVGYLKEGKNEILSLTLFKKYMKSCEDNCEFYKIRYRYKNDEGLQKVAIRIGTDFNGFKYILTVMCPEKEYLRYEELFQKILASIDIDCKEQEEW